MQLKDFYALWNSGSRPTRSKTANNPENSTGFLNMTPVVEENLPKIEEIEAHQTDSLLVKSTSKNRLSPKLKKKKENDEAKTLKKQSKLKYSKPKKVKTNSTTQFNSQTHQSNADKFYYDKCKICDYIISLLPYHKCMKCPIVYHKHCYQERINEKYPSLKLKGDNPFKRKTDNFICTECKECTICHSSKGVLMECAQCYKIYHSECHKKPPITINNQFICFQCSICFICHHELAVNCFTDFYEHLVCLNCNKGVEKKEYCPICLKSWKIGPLNTDKNMVQCICKFWVHRNCDKAISGEESWRLVNNENSKYMCPICRYNFKAVQIFEFIRLLSRLDEYEIFLFPVDGNHYKNYYSVISKPMDFFSMCQKALQFKYNTETSRKIRSDFELTMSNARIYNMPKDLVYAESIRIQNLGNFIIDQFQDVLDKKINEIFLFHLGLCISFREKEISMLLARQHYDITINIKKRAKSLIKIRVDETKEFNTFYNNYPQFLEFNLDDMYDILKAKNEALKNYYNFRRKEPFYYKNPNDDIILDLCVKLGSSALGDDTDASSQIDSERKVNDQNNGEEDIIAQSLYFSKENSGDRLVNINMPEGILAIPPNENLTSTLTEEDNFLKEVLVASCFNLDGDRKPGKSFLFFEPAPTRLNDLSLLPASQCYLCGGYAQDMFQCSRCFECYHEYCIFKNGKPKTLTDKPFLCLKCKTCSRCNRRYLNSSLFPESNEIEAVRNPPFEEVLQCVTCGDVVHFICEYPFLAQQKKLPFSQKWKCSKCFSCISCSSCHFFSIDCQFNLNEFDYNYIDDFNKCYECSIISATKKFCMKCKQYTGGATDIEIWKKILDGEHQLGLRYLTENDLNVVCQKCGGIIHTDCIFNQIFDNSRISALPYTVKFSPLNFYCYGCLIKIEVPQHQLTKQLDEEIKNLHKEHIQQLAISNLVDCCLPALVFENPDLELEALLKNSGLNFSELFKLKFRNYLITRFKCEGNYKQLAERLNNDAIIYSSLNKFLKEKSIFDFDENDFDDIPECFTLKKKIDKLREANQKKNNLSYRLTEYLHITNKENIRNFQLRREVSLNFRQKKGFFADDYCELLYKDPISIGIRSLHDFSFRIGQSCHEYWKSFIVDDILSDMVPINKINFHPISPFLKSEIIINYYLQECYIPCRVISITRYETTFIKDFLCQSFNFCQDLLMEVEQEEKSSALFEYLAIPKKINKQIISAYQFGLESLGCPVTEMIRALKIDKELNHREKCAKQISKFFVNGFVWMENLNINIIQYLYEYLEQNTIDEVLVLHPNEIKRKAFSSIMAKYSAELTDFVLPDSMLQDKICILCKKKGQKNISGSLMSVYNWAWMHVNCALWSENVYEKLNGEICNIYQNFKTSFNKKCYYCNEMFATLKCYGKDCDKRFHFPCGLSNRCAFTRAKVTYCEECWINQNMKALENIRNYVETFELLCKIYLMKDFSIKRKLIPPCFQNSSNNIKCIINHFYFTDSNEWLPEELLFLKEIQKSEPDQTLSYTRIGSVVIMTWKPSLENRIYSSKTNLQDNAIIPFPNRFNILKVINEKVLKYYAIKKENLEAYKGLTQFSFVEESIDMREPKDLFSIFHSWEKNEYLNCFNHEESIKPFTGNTILSEFNFTSRLDFYDYFGLTNSLIKNYLENTVKEELKLTTSPLKSFNITVGILHTIFNQPDLCVYYGIETGCNVMDRLNKIQSLIQVVQKKMEEESSDKKTDNPRTMSLYSKRGKKTLSSTTNKKNLSSTNEMVEYNFEFRMANEWIEETETAQVFISKIREGWRQWDMRSVTVGPSPIHKYGLFANKHIKKGEFVIEYVGECIRNVLSDLRERSYEIEGFGDCFMFRIDKNTVIDATHAGNQARYLNHCCDPNCSSIMLEIEGKKRIIMYASKNITRGDELTYDYQFDVETKKISCTCRSKNCQGRLN